MSILSEFREFAARGNVVDLAVGVIMGAAFGKITTSLVDEIVMPVVGLALGKVNFADLLIALDGKTYASLKAAKDAGAPVIAYGSFLNTILNFLITAFVVFMLVKAINALRRKKEEEVVEPAAPELSMSEKLLTEIRDSLKKP